MSGGQKSCHSFLYRVANRPGWRVGGRVQLMPCLPFKAALAISSACNGAPHEPNMMIMVHTRTTLEIVRAPSPNWSPNTRPGCNHWDRARGKRHGMVGNEDGMDYWRPPPWARRLAGWLGWRSWHPWSGSKHSHLSRASSRPPISVVVAAIGT